MDSQCLHCLALTLCSSYLSAKTCAIALEAPPTGLRFPTRKTKGAQRDEPYEPL